MGYIDIVAGNVTQRLVIECKRGADATWLFIVNKTDPDQEKRICTFCTDKSPGEDNVSLWEDISVTPQSPESNFCVVRGQGDKEPMLERLGATLLRSTEAIADEEFLVGMGNKHHEIRFYFPIVVTAANLLISRFDPGDVDLSSGKLPSDKVEFEETPFVRFRKQMLGTLSEKQYSSLEQVQKENERTLLIVQAKAFERLLNEWDIHPMGLAEQWPQRRVREWLKSQRARSSQ